MKWAEITLNCTRDGSEGLNKPVTTSTEGKLSGFAVRSRYHCYREAWLVYGLFYTIDSGGFRGGRAGSGPPLGDRLTPSLTVMLANTKF